MLKEWVKQIDGNPLNNVTKSRLEDFAEQIDKRFSEHIEAEGQFSREMSADLEKKINDSDHNDDLWTDIGKLTDRIEILENKQNFLIEAGKILEERIKSLEENKNWTEARLATMFKSIELLENKPRIVKNPTFGMGIEHIIQEDKIDKLPKCKECGTEVKVKSEGEKVIIYCPECEKKEPEWEDITESCEFVPQTDIIDEFWIKIKYKEKFIGGITDEMWINTLFEDKFKIEKGKGWFKILKKVE